jgi:hypothetical protein
MLGLDGARARTQTASELLRPEIRAHRENGTRHRILIFGQQHLEDPSHERARQPCRSTPRPGSGANPAESAMRIRVICRAAMCGACGRARPRAGLSQMRETL